ncbi:DUF77 domain-containing protein [Campylobacter blaseri]|uniref:Thiamine-binding protein domain-containing protein n=1 Tax=Campylobacter blaseri TaxID=2042961 RepID=A0A2P8QYG2_9BACT|nr:thiamine-binding protein [Campylobacter blaseri]PSM51285.1 hypothetical protein CQ405_08620 [Campylobacter blaseri]PSM52429.1 hypothetical protein CRN67_08625 [Campylobacter blaseri]QKF86242.1 DUF77 domain-containing protein [Campylobacter blaseri]
MSVVVSFSIFSLYGDKSKAEEIAKVHKVLKELNVKCELNAMNSVFETESLKEAFFILEKCNEALSDYKRVYLNANFDIKNSNEKLRIKQKVKSVEEIIKNEFN